MTRKRRARKRDWAKDNADEIETAAQLPLTDLVEVPFTAVVRGDVEYRIHGLPHGQRRVFRLRPRVKEWMRSRIEAMDEPPDENFVTERGFARLLGFEKSSELDYSRDLMERLGPRKVLLLVAVSLSAIFWIPFAVMALRFSRDPETRELRAALRDERHLTRVRRLHELTELPAEIDFELQPHSLRVVHSQVMVDALVARAERTGVKLMHVICGLAHEQDLVYLLGRS